MKQHDAGKRLKERFPKIKLVVVQPYPGSGLAGLRTVLDGYVPPILDMSTADASEFVQDEEAFRVTRNITKKYGIFGGVSSGAVLAKSIQYAQNMDKGTVVTILPDGGWKYLSLRLWTTEPSLLVKKPHGQLW